MKITKKHLLACFIAVFSMPSLTQCGSHETLEVQYIPVKESKDGNWGFVGPDGTVICPDEFKNGPSVVTEGVFSVTEGKERLVSLYKIGDKLKVIPNCEGFKEVGIMKEGLIPTVRKKERIKILDKDGNMKFELGGHGIEIQSCAGLFSDGMLLVRDNNGKYGYYNKKGELVIKPQYDGATDFQNGRALVCKENKNGNTRYQIIDHNNSRLVELKKGAEDVYLFENHISYRTGKLQRIFDINGEEILKCKEYASDIADIRGEYFAFINNDNEWGVMSLKGETIIRAKYQNITLLPNGKFLCFDDKKNELNLINDKDEKIKTIDANAAKYVPGFGILVKYDDYYLVYNNDLEKQGKTEFYDINLGANSYVESDFFDASALASQMLKAFNDNFKDVSLGASPSSIKILLNAEPNEVSYSSEYQWEISENNAYSIKGVLDFDKSITNGSIGGSSSDFKLNDAASLINIGVLMRLSKHKSHSGEIALALGEKISSQLGLTEIEKNKQGAFYSKGDMLYVTIGHENEVLYMVTKKTPEMLQVIKKILSDARPASEDEDYATEDITVGIPENDYACNDSVSNVVVEEEVAAVDTTCTEEAVVTETVVAPY